MKYAPLFALIALLWTNACVSAGNPDLDAMQGKWQVVFAEKGNEELPADQTVLLQVVIKGKSLSLIQDGKPVMESTIAVDPPAKLGTFKLTAKKGDDVALGIYELGPKTLQLCWDNALGSRPAKFSGTNESASLINLKLSKK